MAQPARDLRLTYDEYLALEQETDLRHEYIGGVVWAMAGGSLRHSAMKVNLTGAVYTALRGQPCRAYDADAKVRVAVTDHAAYPDLSIVCGDVQRDNRDSNALANPTALFEVLSPGTEAWDRGGKFISYQHLDSLQHYVLIDFKAVCVEHYARIDGDQWTYTRLGEGETLVMPLPGGDLRMSIDAIYADLPDQVSEPLSPYTTARDEPYSASHVTRS